MKWISLLLIYFVFGLFLTTLNFTMTQRNFSFFNTAILTLLFGYLITNNAFLSLLFLAFYAAGFLLLRKFLQYWEERSVSLIFLGISSFVVYILSINPLLIPVNLVSFGFFALSLFHILDVGGRKKFLRRLEPSKEKNNYYPKISLHIPIYEEPIDIVKRTLYSIAKIDWPNYEVCVIVNNTKKEKFWKPIKEICENLGEKFRFFHLPECPGYKAGALNFALSITSPDAEIIGVIDADYEVKPDFLKATVPFFKDPDVAVVQTPQDYREFPQSMEGVYWSYRYFFTVIMNSCNEHNAASFMGTMGLIRKKCLEEIGGWDEKVITEDSELGIRIHSKGWKTIYIDTSFGKGLMPFTFGSYKKQRFRWAFGNMQTLIKNFKNLLSNNLTIFQKICYFGSNTVWFNNLLIPWILLCFSVLLDKEGADKVSFSLIGPFAAFIFTNILAFLVVLPRFHGFSVKKGFSALMVFLSLTWVMSVAWLLCLIKKERGFWRTPKIKKAFKLTGFLKDASTEIIILLISAKCATVAFLKGCWISGILLFVNTVLYLPSLFAYKWFKVEETHGRRIKNANCNFGSSVEASAS